jgi:putative integral membrane protein (TIGR02587 family)
MAGVDRGSVNRRFAVGLARASAGAIIFSLPLFMTEEMWNLGVAMDRFRLAGLIGATVPLLLGLSYFAGFEKTRSVIGDARDAMTAYLIGFVAASLVLLTIGVLDRQMSPDELIGLVALQAVPAAIGALISRSQLGDPEQHEETRDKEERAGYWGELFLMAAGAIVLAFNVAPTVEVQSIAARLSMWHALGIIVLSIAIMHGFVYAMDFRGGHSPAPGQSPWAAFAHFTVAGYAIAVIVSGYILWSFGRMDGASSWDAVTSSIVLGLPAAVGAAIARLVL